MTPKQEKFVHEYCTNGGNGTQAAIAAGYSPVNARTIAAQNLAKSYIADAVEGFRAENAAKAEITVESLARELEKDRELARRLDQPSAAVAATNAIAKLYGLQAEDRKNNRAPVEDFVSWMASNGRDTPRAKTTH